MSCNKYLKKKLKDKLERLGGKVSPVKRAEPHL